MVQKLSQYRNKRVRVIDTDGVRYVGFVTLYTHANDNDIDEDAIVIDDNYWLDAHEIKDISIID